MRQLSSGEVLFTNADDAQKRCAEWQRALLLQDWEIVVHIKRGRDMVGSDRSAEVIYNRDKKMAIINLVDPQDYENKDWSLDHEKSMVHELIHLHLAFSDPLVEANRDAKRELEVAVDSLARALTRVLRNSEKYFVLGSLGGPQGSGITVQ